MQKRNWIYLVIFTFAFFNVQKALAQFSLSGRVTDSSTREAIEAAGISLSGPVKRVAYTDARGYFKTAQLPKGQYTLKVHYIGYKTLEKNILVNKNLSGLQFPLKEIGLFIQPIEVTSTRAGAHAPFTKTNISGKALNKKNLGQGLPVLLKQQPSVFITSDAGAGVGYTNMWIRGSDISRINVTFNGIPVNDAESAGAFFVDIPDIASSTDNLQIQRGVGTSTNGAGAFGATINLSTNTFHAEPYGSIMNSYGSFNTWKHSVKAGSGLLNDHFTIDARLSSITSDGYIDRASSDLKSYYLSGAYFNKKTAVRFNIFSGKEKTYQAWNGVPEDTLKAGHRTYNGLGLMPDGGYYDNQTDNYTQTYYQLFLNQEINNQWNFNVAAFLTRGKGYYEEYKMDEPYSDYGLENPVIGKDTLKTTNLIRDLWLDNYYYGTVFSVNYKNESFSSTLGGGWNRYDGKHYGKVIWAEHAIEKGYRYYYNIAHKNDLNIYWKGNKAITDGLTAFLDLQYRHVLYDINGFKHRPDVVQHNRYDFFNPKAGLNYRPDAHNRFYASYALAHKEPNRDDFEANIKGKPKAEKLSDLEIGYDRNGRFYNLHANIYYMYYKNQLVLTGKINDVGSAMRTNAPESYRLGLELNGTLHFAEILTFSANATFSQNKIRNFTEYLDNWDNDGREALSHGETTISFSPSVISGATLSVAPFKDFTAALSGKYVSRRYLDNAEARNRSLDPYLVNDLQLHYTWTPKGIKGIDFQLLVNNLFNVSYLTNGYTYAYLENKEVKADNSYFPQAGTNFLFGITINL